MFWLKTRARWSEQGRNQNEGCAEAPVRLKMRAVRYSTRRSEDSEIIAENQPRKSGMRGRSRKEFTSGGGRRGSFRRNREVIRMSSVARSPGAPWTKLTSAVRRIPEVRTTNQRHADHQAEATNSGLR